MTCALNLVLSVQDVREGGDVLQAAHQLGLDISALHYGEERPGVASSGEFVVNVETVPAGRARQQGMRKVLDQRRAEGKSVVFVNKPLSGSRPGQTAPARPAASGAARPAPPGPTAAAPASSGPPPTPVQIKKERAETVAEVPTATAAGDEGEPMEHSGGRAGEQQQKPATVPVPVSAPPSTPAASTEQLKCQKCPKGFGSLTQLKYHYTQHFKTLLKSKYSNLITKDNKCKICSKQDEIGKLMLHVGVIHGKIEEILKARGIKLPEDFSKETEKNKNVKNEPKIPSVSTPAAPVAPPTQPGPSPAPNPCPAPGLATEEQSESGTADGSATKRPGETDCNFELVCQVCNNPQRTLTLLEQHCCRHFFKELQEKYADIIDGKEGDFRCTICDSRFKQKHSLLLHIGCKHGKINDILVLKSYKALPCPVNSNSNNSMQKQLIKIKKERMEDSRENPNETSKMETEGSAVGSSDAPPAESGFDSSLDEILKKYKIVTGIASGSQSA